MPERIGDQLPDPGRLLLDLYEGTDPTVQEQVAAEVARVRFPSGGYDLREHKYDKRSGPVGLLCWITTGDWIAAQVWAVHDLGGAQKRQVQATVGELCRNQGVPAAATWALTAWKSTDRRAPSVDILSDMLASSYNEWLGKVTNGMFMDSIRKWRRP